MPIAYLTPDAAQSRLIATGRYTADNAPTVEVLGWALEDLEVLLDGWLGFRAAPTQYKEKLSTNEKGIALMSYYPVVSVESVMVFQDYTAGVSSTPIIPLPVNSVWRQTRSLFLNMNNTPLEVTYTAGLDPLPRLFTQKMWALLLKVDEAGELGGDLGFLEEPAKDIASLSLPGGLTKTFRATGGSSGGGDGAPTTVLDQVLAGLDKYRQRVVAVY